MPYLPAPDPGVDRHQADAQEFSRNGLGGQAVVRQLPAEPLPFDATFNGHALPGAGRVPLDPWCGCWVGHDVEITKL